MHGHEQQSLAEGVLDAMLVTAPLVVSFLVVVLFLAGLLRIPVGYERGKVAWVEFCATGMHLHTVYWSGESGFQTMHPADRSGGERQ